MKRLLTISALVALTAFATGCVHHSTSKHINPPTLGEELTALKSALETGAIDADEYQKQRKDLLDGERWEGGECELHKHHH